MSSRERFANALARYTGLTPRVVAAWMAHEQGSTTVGGGNNWLNIETGLKGGSGPHGATANYVETLSPEGAARVTAEWLRRYQPGILAARGKGEAAEAQAIIASPYAESHYNYESPSTFLSAAGSVKPGGGGGGLPLAAIPGSAGNFLLEGANAAGKLAEGAASGVLGGVAQGLAGSLEEAGLYVVLVLAGLALVVYGVMVAVRPREGPLGVPTGPAVRAAVAGAAV